MPLSLFSIFIGFILGGALTAIAWNMTSRTVRNPETAKLTNVWSLKDVAAQGTRPAIMAERLDGINVPPGSKILIPTGAASAIGQQILETCDVRMHNDVRINAAVGSEMAIIFSGRIGPRSLALITSETTMMERLRGDFTRMWADSSPLVEPTAINTLADKIGRTVDVTGRATEIMEYRGRKMLRLTDGKVAVGVVAKNADVTPMQGGTIRVIGKMTRDGGYPYIEAEQLQTINDSPTLAA